MSTLAITGSTGHLGGLVAHALADLSPRLIVRDTARAPSIPGATVAQASYGDRAASIEALLGVDVLFMVSASESRTRREEHRTFIDAAAEAGVSHLVYTSFSGAAEDATFTLGRDHHDAEQAIVASGIAHTILRDNFYLDLLPFFAGEDGVIRGPAGDGRVAAVARADVAEVAAEVLRSPEDHAGTTYELTGPESLTLAEIATRAGAILGRTLTFEDESVEDAYASRLAAYGAEQWQLDAWVSTYTAIRDGECARLTDDVRKVTGRRPRSLERALRP
ncbi:NAD(P)H dehydrogenase (quinone) [Marmoricola sp. OAE513]|uniref:SDR family oxidoreductase n=1 Tax=Marmoricola sp. OAE513 TaxID=2817894 RepID=UPI001AE71E7A